MELLDGTFAVCARTESFPTTKNSLLLINLDTNGNVLWSRSAAGEDTNWPASMIATSDGGLLIGGFSRNGLTANNDNAVFKFDSAGDIDWLGLYGGAANDYAYASANA